MKLTESTKAVLAVNRIANRVMVQFDPVAGQTYYLYEREDESFFISLVAPQYWSAKTPPLTYVSDVEFIPSSGWKRKS
tara:strand:- start:390 stop:623 length:234 start_codon:yes stop_codon:yes gene_type:complete